MSSLPAMTGCIERMRTLLAALNPARLEIIDESQQHAGHSGAKGGGGHYLLQIVSARFQGCNTLARHRMVYSALGELMQRDIHALTIQAYTPDEHQTGNEH